MSNALTLTSLPREILTLILYDVYTETHVKYLIRVPKSRKANGKVSRKFVSPMLVNKLISEVARQVFPTVVKAHMPLEKYLQLTRSRRGADFCNDGDGVLSQFRCAAGNVTFAVILLTDYMNHDSYKASTGGLDDYPFSKLESIIVRESFKIEESNDALLRLKRALSLFALADVRLEGYLTVWKDSGLVNAYGLSCLKLVVRDKGPILVYEANNVYLEEARSIRGIIEAVLELKVKLPHWPGPGVLNMVDDKVGWIREPLNKRSTKALCIRNSAAFHSQYRVW